MRIVVDLPAPFGPISPMIWPRGTFSSISSSEKNRYFLQTPRSSIAKSS